MKINIKKLLFNILVPLLLGLLVGFLTNKYNNYDEIVLPTFAPSGIVFPIVWSILYILMGISSYLISNSNDYDKDNALFIYYIKLFINLFWSIIFFIFRNYLLSFIWIILLLIFLMVTIYKFYKIDKKAAYLLIPYFFWTVFATVLNFYVYLMN